MINFILISVFQCAGFKNIKAKKCKCTAMELFYLKISILRFVFSRWSEEIEQGMAGGIRYDEPVETLGFRSI